MPSLESLQIYIIGLTQSYAAFWGTFWSTTK